MSKITTLDQLKQLATRVKTEDDALSVKIEAVASEVESLVATGGEANILEGVKVNGTALAITDKMVDILIAAGEENGTISVNGAAVAITGLQALAYKSQISEADLDEALKASIAAKATEADLQALTVRVGDIESAGYQNAEQVSAAIQTAISESGHAHFEEVAAVPTAEEAEANVLYLVMNEETQHYDIYALVGENVVLIDDTTVDLSGYSTTEAMQAYVTEQIAALNVDQYATDEELQAVIIDIGAIQTALANVYTKEEADAKFMDEAEAQTIAESAASAAVTGAQATDEEFNAAMNEVWTPTSEG